MWRPQRPVEPRYAVFRQRCGEIVLGIRPEDLSTSPSDEAWFSGELMVAERLGSQTYGYIEAGHDRMITVEFPRDSQLTVGETVHVRGNPANVHVFDKSTGKRLN